jgi:hypothetical protein
MVAGNDEQAVPAEVQPPQRRIEELGGPPILGCAARKGRIAREAHQIGTASLLDLVQVLRPSLSQNALPPPVMRPLLMEVRNVKYL